MNLKHIGLVATGGEIFDIVEDSLGRLWVAARAGLFCRNESGWRSMQSTLPIAYVQAVAVGGKTVFVAGQGQMLRSHNGGKNWLPCLIEQTNEWVIDIAVSPNYQSDRVILAGTSAGILRSKNGGKHFELSNFGLDQLTTFQIETSPVWRDHSEYAFMVSTAGIYQSPNGGRAWRASEFPSNDQTTGKWITSVAINKTRDNQAVFISNNRAEQLSGEILISKDGGRSFELFSDGFEHIYSLVCPTSESLLVNTQAGIYQVAQDGTKQKTFEDETITRLFDLASGVYAIKSNGILHSADNGLTWNQDPAFIARRFIWFQTPRHDLWIVGSPDDGIWRSINQGKTWKQVWHLGGWQEGAILGFATHNNQIGIASSYSGIIISNDAGENWTDVITASEHMPPSTLLIDESLWCGTEQAKIWRDGHPLNTPFEGQDLLDLYHWEAGIMAAVWRVDVGVVQLWLTGDEGVSWQQVFAESAERIIPQIGEGLVGIGRKLYQQTPSGWQKFETPSPIVAILNHNNQTLVIQAEQIATFDNGTLTSTPLDLNGQRLASASISGNDLILCSTTGTIWRVDR